MNSELITWLTRDDNPAVKYRAQTELMGLSADRRAAIEWAYGALPEAWYDVKGLWYTYYVTALAECGLERADISDNHIARAFDELKYEFEAGCKDFMLLSALVKLGYADCGQVRAAIDRLGECALPDGGFLCVHRRNKLKYTPKSCYKANLHALMLISRLRKRGINTDFGQPLIDYFLKRDIFYKSGDDRALVLAAREGWRTIDVFYPFEVMRVGLQNVLEAFAALGYAEDTKLSAAWELLDGATDDMGRVALKGTLTKSYLPKERVGKPSKWATLYALLARETPR